MARALREKGLAYLIVGPFAVLLAYPFYVMVITAFKNRTDVYDTTSPLWFKHAPSLENALLIAVVVVAITLALALPAGYALARLGGRVGQGLGVGIFLTSLVPP